MRIVHGEIPVQPDRLILWTSAVLAAFGVLMVFDASAVSAALRTKFLNPSFFLQRHLIWFALGLIAMYMASRVNVSKIKQMILPVTLLTLVLLALVLVPGIGHSVGGSRRWLRLGFISLQPGEFMRLIMAIYLARLLSVKSSRIKQFTAGFLPAVCITGITALLLIAQPKYGTAMILLILSGVMLFVAGISLFQLLTAALLATPVAIYALTNVGYIQHRIDAWLHPARHLQGAGFQMTQSLIAIGSGGLLGSGLGAGRQKMFYLPEAHTDMIFPVISEELGLIGATGVLACFGLLFYRGIQIARTSPDPFAALLAIGLTFCICLPAAINVLVATGLFPVTGVALPLISFGGTALVTDMTALGLLAGIPGWANTGKEAVIEAA